MTHTLVTSADTRAKRRSHGCRSGNFNNKLEARSPGENIIFVSTGRVLRRPRTTTASDGRKRALPAFRRRSSLYVVTSHRNNSQREQGNLHNWHFPAPPLADTRNLWSTSDNVQIAQFILWFNCSLQLHRGPSCNIFRHVIVRLTARVNQVDSHEEMSCSFSFGWWLRSNFL